MVGVANRQRGLISLVQVLGLAVWFSATAVVPTLRHEWGISVAQAVWLTASVQIGFALGAVASAVTNLPDRIAPPRLLAASALGACLCTTLLALLAGNLTTAIPLRFLTGVCLAGIYPVGMKLMASWSTSADRGRAFGVLIGALTLGSALPHLIGGLGSLPWRAVMGTASGLTLAAALIAVLLIRPGPHLAAGAAVREPGYAIRMFGERRPRLVNLGYFGHMWELYAWWTWLPSFLIASQAQLRLGSGTAIGITVFAAIGLAGVAGAWTGGWVSDRFGRPPAAVGALVISGACCAISPLFFGRAWPVLVPFLLVWGGAVIADSGVFSTALSEAADPRFVGTALTTQTAVGFLLTVVSIQLVPLLAASQGWRYAFLLLVPGPVIGAIAMSRLGLRRGPVTAATQVR